MKSESASYKAAGVDITAGYRAVELMKKHVARTMIPGVREGIGGFGGLFELDMTGIQRPVLVSGTDGVGTKLKLAFLMDKHDTVGIDCVAMCVNDIICCGAKPQFFLDYVAVGKNVPERVAQIVGGVAEGMTARIERSAVRVLPIFDIIAREGGIPERDMFNTFNMGVGMCLTVAAEDVDLALDSLADAGENGAYALGEIVRGEGGIELC